MKHKTMEQFVRELASAKPTPGGGSASALGGALAGALSCMVANITLAKEPTHELEKLRDEAVKLYEACLEDVQRDIDAYDSVVVAQKLPKQTDAEKHARQEKLQASLRSAAQVPFETADRILQVLRLTRKMVAHARSSYISDLGVANFMALASLTSAAMNVEINLHAIHDKKYSKAMESKLEALEDEAHGLFAEIESAVKERMLAEA
ncbi:MAG: cyclodeaminase/cyclohydrolase family protein [Candidatus Xenobia bacterium]